MSRADTPTQATLTNTPQESVSASLAATIEAYKAAHTEFEGLWELHVGRDGDDANEAVADGGRRLRAAFEAVLRARVATPADRKAKLALIGEHAVMLESFDAIDIVEAIVVADEPPAPTTSPDRDRWTAARQAYFAALDAVYNDEDIPDEDPRFGVMLAARERWGSSTPPDLQSLAEIMSDSLVNSLPWEFQGVSNPWALRDLLDSGDAYKIFAARFFMHVQRMVDSESQVLVTPPIAGLYPAIDADAVSRADPDDMERVWEAQHAQLDPHPVRVAEYAEWVEPPPRNLHGRVAIRCAWDHQAAVFQHSRALLDEYEGLGGSFDLVCREHEYGKRSFAVPATAGSSARAVEIEQYIGRHENLQRGIAILLRNRAAEVVETKPAQLLAAE